MSKTYQHTSGFDERKPLQDKDITIEKGKNPMVMDVDKKERKQIQAEEANATKKSDLVAPAEMQIEEKKNASERIDLQHIMELREAFEEADADAGGSLDLEEFVNAFGGVIGKNMNIKQLNQLFMKIDADAGGTVDWQEFMNYMLLENQTLNSMKQEHSEYQKTVKIDPPPIKKEYCHASNITSIIILYPQDYQDNPRGKQNQELEVFDLQRDKKNIKFVTGATDGTVKVWTDFGTRVDQTIQVSEYYVLAIAFMTYSKRLVAASADRMISFYEINSGQKSSKPISRIENLVGVPQCLEYYRWPDPTEEKAETLLIGDDMGICTMYTFGSGEWHLCQFRKGAHNKNDCHLDQIEKNYKEEIEKEYNELKEEKKRQRRNFQKSQKKNENDKRDFENQEDSSKNKHAPRMKKRALGFEKINQNVAEPIVKQIHKGWITNIKYYPDLTYIISSSLDGFIHIHDIESLEYKTNKTFNLHQKGINSFIYSPKHRFVASCGEERHIIMWDPFTRGQLAFLYGHNTSVQDLAINEERHHLISLGTDKVVKIWDIRNYVCIQTIFDKQCYRPEDILTSLKFEPHTSYILLGSRKINFWPFKTQEEIKTSHESNITFALYNRTFEAVVSADEDGFIAVWDIENGKLMSKFGDGHGEKNKITAGCFDSSKRRLITAGVDGTCKIWNFSNGSLLTDLMNAEGGEKVDQEITSMCCVYDPEDEEEQLHFAYIIAVGWDRRVRIWQDEKEEKCEVIKDLPKKNQHTTTVGHKDDIMSCVHYGGLIFTGGHDGTLLAWNFETGFIKLYLHEYDPDCTSTNYIKESKSVDCLLILEKKNYLLSGSSDGWIRFWKIDDLTNAKKPPKMHIDHDPEDALTALNCNEDNDRLITCDTSGRIKLWDISKIQFEGDKVTNIKDIWFIQAHKSIINSVQVVEKVADATNETFIITASADCNILLHKMSTGVKVGQFGQDGGWNIKDLSHLEKSRPNLVRKWFKSKKDIKILRMQAIAALKKEYEKLQEAEAIEQKEGKENDFEFMYEDKIDAAKGQYGDEGGVDLSQYSSEEEVDEYQDLKGKRLRAFEPSRPTDKKKTYGANYTDKPFYKPELQKAKDLRNMRVKLMQDFREKNNDNNTNFLND